MTEPTTERRPIDPFDPPAPAPTPAEKTPLWEDFIDIFHAPSDVFRRRQHGSWFVPALIIAVLVGILMFANAGVMQPIFDAEWARQVPKMREQNPRITDDQLATMRSFGETTQRYGGVVIIPIAVALIGLMTWLVAKFVDAKQELRAAMVVAAYSYVPRVVEQILAAIQGLILDPASLNSRFSLQLGPARFLDPDTTSPVVLALVGRLDAITIWITVLLAIGLYATGKVSKRQAAIGGVLFWVVGGLFPLLGALRQ